MRTDRGAVAGSCVAIDSCGSAQAGQVRIPQVGLVLQKVHPGFQKLASSVSVTRQSRASTVHPILRIRCVTFRVWPVRVGGCKTAHVMDKFELTS
jgi:hypothetical protein